MGFAKEALAIATRFRKNPSVATLLPTFPWTARKIANLMQTPAPKNIVEWGAGTGSVTKALLKKLPPDGTLVAIENDPVLFEALQENIHDPRMIPIEGDARDTAELLEHMGLPPPEYLVSGIPFDGMSEEMRREMMERAYEVLAQDGVFLPYQFRSTIRQALQDKFGDFEMTPAYENLFPPYDLYEARKNESDDDRMEPRKHHSPAASTTEMRQPSHANSSVHGSYVNGKATNGSAKSSRLMQTWGHRIRQLIQRVGARNGWKE